MTKGESKPRRNPEQAPAKKSHTLREIPLRDLENVYGGAEQNIKSSAEENVKTVR